MLISLHCVAIKMKFRVLFRFNADAPIGAVFALYPIHVATNIVIPWIQQPEQPPMLQRVSTTMTYGRANRCTYASDNDENNEEEQEVEEHSDGNNDNNNDEDDYIETKERRQRRREIRENSFNERRCFGNSHQEMCAMQQTHTGGFHVLHLSKLAHAMALDIQLP